MKIESNSPIASGTLSKSTLNEKAAIDSKDEGLKDDQVSISREAMDQQVQIGTDPFDPKKKEN
ncbi:hypothetical protein MHM95_12500 [Pseudoalteromonas sp. CnMc7-15]|uniref:hypothetical protein n=1 Tax=unclassified Pseudoalteromonas TaxID=194690 RepID=UPI001EF44858|nr:hypothetical protein [Pseudoalteromonas sp. CnMc7-15]MCG7567101.1 hypothetical protein [Pseudoalteromonas sp. CnMc7-15]